MIRRQNFQIDGNAEGDASLCKDWALISRFPNLKAEEKNVKRMSCVRKCENNKNGFESNGSLFQIDRNAEDD